MKDPWLRNLVDQLEADTKTAKEKTKSASRTLEAHGPVPVVNGPPRPRKIILSGPKGAAHD